jgi:hypothetical protein
VADPKDEIQALPPQNSTENVPDSDVPWFLRGLGLTPGGKKISGGVGDLIRRLGSQSPGQPTSGNPAPSIDTRLQAGHEKSLDTETVLNNPDLSRYGYRTMGASVAETPPVRRNVAPPNAGDSDKNFAVAVAIYTGTAVTGLFLLATSTLFSGSWWYGAVYVVGGGIGAMSVTPLFRQKLDVMRSPRSLWAAAIATWLFLAANLGLLVYDKWEGATSPKSTVVEPAGFGFAPVKPPESHIGETFSIELAQLLHELPQPCLIKITNPANTELGSLINWVTTYGNMPNGHICAVEENTALPDVDKKYVKPTTDAGMVIHWNADYAPAAKLAHFFDSSGVIVRISHQLDGDSPSNLIWFDIGPGSPWK